MESPRRSTWPRSSLRSAALGLYENSKSNLSTYWLGPVQLGFLTAMMLWPGVQDWMMYGPEPRGWRSTRLPHLATHSLGIAEVNVSVKV